MAQQDFPLGFEIRAVVSQPLEPDVREVLLVLVVRFHPVREYPYGLHRRVVNPIQQVGVGCPALRLCLVKGKRHADLSVPEIKSGQFGHRSGIVQQAGEILQGFRCAFLQPVDQDVRNVQAVAVGHAVDQGLAAVQHEDQVLQLCHRSVPRRNRNVHLGDGLRF